MAIRAIAFDLDDTLMDTSGILAPTAAENAFKILREAGLSLSLAECEQKRTEWIKSISHKDVFEKLARDYGNQATLKVVDQANKAFYEPLLPEKLPLLEGALENLEQLYPKYALYVVTAGFHTAQNEKVKALGISHFFKKVFVVDSLNKERKYDSFQKILKLEHIQASELLCIGNSLSSEIKDALLLGAQSCYFEFGEDRGHSELLKNYQPLFRVQTHKEIITTCRL